MTAHAPLPMAHEIKDYTKDELTRVLIRAGYPAYRAGQVFRWLYRGGAGDFGMMKDLPAAMREDLKVRFTVSRPHLRDEKASRLDGTRKYLLGLKDSHVIETVYLPEARRATVCVSSQVGCKHACSFCASAILGFARNLRPSEIVDEVLFITAVKGFSLTNVVFMGIGEPFDNYENVMTAIRIMNDPDGLMIGARKITVSTCGLIPGIERFAGEGIQAELSVSLHAADDLTRSRLVPVNKRYPLKDLMGACRQYIEKTNRVITFEYVLMKGVNAGPGDAGRLAALLKGMKCKVNLIVYNQIRSLGYEAPGREEARRFAQRLATKGVTATLRKSRGEDIDAGCGQLRISRME